MRSTRWRRSSGGSTRKQLGPSGVGVMGSGQYTIMEGYAAAKLVKAGWRSNNLDPNARHCMASAVAAFMQTFGIDEPSGCYDDIERTDAVVTWGANMAEMHPMLWSRVVDTRLATPRVPDPQPHDVHDADLRRLATPTSCSSRTRISRSGTTSRGRSSPGARSTGTSSRSTASSRPGQPTSASGCAPERTTRPLPRRTRATASAPSSSRRRRRSAAASTRPSRTRGRRRTPRRPASTGSCPSRTSGRLSSRTPSNSSPRSRRATRTSPSRSTRGS